MDKQIPTFCAEKRLDPEDATLVLNGVPFCNTQECWRKQCLRQAEQQSRRKAEGAWNGA